MKEMEKEKKKPTEEKMEETPTTSNDESSPLLPKPKPKAEVEIHLFRQGKGPIDVFKSRLGGWDQDQLEVRDILDKYALKSIYAFNSQSARGVPIRFHPKNGLSILPYTHGSVIFVDGDPKDSLLKPITKILLWVAVITVLIVLFMKETPQWAKKLNFSGGSIPPWVLACVVVVFTRMRKRTRDFLKNRGM